MEQIQQENALRQNSRSPTHIPSTPLRLLPRDLMGILHLRVMPQPPANGPFGKPMSWFLVMDLTSQP